MRENGYYWVRFKRSLEWDVAHLKSGMWFFCGYDPDVTDEEILDSYDIGEKVERKEKP